jgi:hypothetical protein
MKEFFWAVAEGEELGSNILQRCPSSKITRNRPFPRAIVTCKRGSTPGSPTGRSRRLNAGSLSSSESNEAEVSRPATGYRPGLGGHHEIRTNDILALRLRTATGCGAPRARSTRHHLIVAIPRSRRHASHCMQGGVNGPLRSKEASSPFAEINGFSFLLPLKARRAQSCPETLVAADRRVPPADLR